MNHIRSQHHQLRKPGEIQGTKYYKTFCNQYVPYAATTPFASEVNCQICVRGLIEKKQSEIEKIKMFLDD